MQIGMFLYYTDPCAVKVGHTEVFNDLYGNDTTKLHAHTYTHTHTQTHIHTHTHILTHTHTQESLSSVMKTPHNSLFFPSLFSFSTHGPPCWLHMCINKQMHLYGSEGWRSPLCKRKSLWCCSSTSFTRAWDINHTAEKTIQPDTSHIRTGKERGVCHTTGNDGTWWEMKSRPQVKSVLGTKQHSSVLRMLIITQLFPTTGGMSVPDKTSSCHIFWFSHLISPSNSALTKHRHTHTSGTHFHPPFPSSWLPTAHMTCTVIQVPAYLQLSPLI